MGTSGMQAWVTSAVEDKVVNKAIVLAGSLRRVRTAKKLAVLTSLAVSKELRNKLKDVFDLVVLLEQESPNGINLEDYAKVEGFCLMIFSKCVYLSPDSLVLKNCDELFDKYDSYAFCGSPEEVDSTVYVFTPSMDFHWTLNKNANATGSGNKGNSSKHFNKWIQDQLPTCAEKLDEQYNLKLYLKDGIEKSIDTNLVIAHFVDIHPLDLPEEIFAAKDTKMGAVEMFAVNSFWKIYLEDVKNSMLKTPTHFQTTRRYRQEPVAIVGLSFRLPGGNNVDEFWDLLANGRDAIRTLPSHRWSRNHTWVPCMNRKVEAGFLNFPIDEFDAKFFGISPKEAVFIDPQQRLLHEVTWEALEDSGIDPLTLRGTQTGVYVGSWIHDYKDIAVRTSDVDFFRVYMGTSIAAEAARLSYFLGTTGPSIATESGCSSAIVGLDLACKSLRNHESNLAISCGVNVLIHPFDKNTLSFVIAPDGRCKTFDAKANGFGRAEACAALVMKRLSDAVRDGDNIWGLIRGSAVTQEGLSKSLGTPTVHCEALAMELALKDAGVHPKQVSFVETHGTGTPVGDPMEVAAITRAYSKDRNEPLLIGSVKTNVGHTESVSGLTGIIKVLLSLKNETIPPHINLDTLNPEINLDLIPAQIPLNPVAWPRTLDKPRIAGVSSFGISGTDGHAIIEEPPIINKSQMDFDVDRPLHIMKISAKSPESFEELLSKYETTFSEKEDQSGFSDVAYSANTGRATFNHRAVIIAQDFQQAAKVLKDKSFKRGDVQSAGSRLCFLFTGQGSQYPNMAANLYSTSPIFRVHFDRCNKVLQEKYNISMKDVLWGDSQNGDVLSRTLYSQTSIFCVEYCLLKLWESWGVKADFVLGHSLGEFCAAVAAGAINFDDALMLVAERSRFIDNLPRGKMLVIKADKKTVDQTIGKYKETHPDFWVDYAAVNSPEQTVVAGDSTMIEDFFKFCAGRGLKAIILAATHAFHSRHMDPMLEPYRKIAATVKHPMDPDAPKYISGMEGRLVDVEELHDPQYWVRHTREKVSFMDACKVAQNEGCTLFLEVGPHPVLSALAMINIEGTPVTCLPSIRRKENEWTTILESLGKLHLSDWRGDIDWRGFDRVYKRNRVSLPFYPFNRKPVWAKIRHRHPKFHPLVGKLVPTASGQVVFEKELTLKGVSFAQDHVIGNTVVFPGAGFLEMCLTGGHCSVQGSTDNILRPRRPIAIRGLKITSPLALYDSELCLLQTVVSLDEQNEDQEIGYTVGVYRHDDTDGSSTGQWMLHASGKFLPVVPSTIPELTETPIDIPTIQETWEKSDNKDFYDKLPEVGLRFGPKFQSLEGGWKNKSGILLKVKVPEDYEDFLMHPVVADAMIQSLMLWSSKDKIRKKLQVPVHIGEFVWLATSSQENSQKYIYCGTNDAGKTYTILLDEFGTQLAYMASVDFAETTVKLVEGMIYQQSVAMAKTWEEIWKNYPGPLQGVLDPATLTIPKRPSDEIWALIEQYNNTGDDERSFYKNVCNLTRLFVLNALYTLGWEPKLTDVFTVEDIIAQFKVRDTFRNYIHFFFRSLAHEGVLQIVAENKRAFRFITKIPSKAEVSTGLKQLSSPSDTSRAEYRLIAELGKTLADIFVGKIEPLAVLFPEDSKMPDAGQFYDAMRKWTEDTIILVSAKIIMPFLFQMQEEYNKKGKQGRPLFRILEVGAGTGVFSKIIMNYLAEKNIEFEFYYTDVSAAFFTNAEKLFEKHLKSIIFKKFDMEEDPLQQGLCPQYFDLILACEVLHVAKDIRKVLKNIRSLLKPGGMFEILETVIPDPRITFIFGLLEGYWKFEDHDFRPYHATLTFDKWEEALATCKFRQVNTIPCYNEVHGIMVAVASVQEETPLAELGEQKHSWIIFGDAEGKDEMTNLLKNKLIGLNRKVYVLSKPSNYVESEVKDMMRNAIKVAYEEVERLEGIIYLWGLSMNVEYKNQTEISLPFVSLCQTVVEMEKIPPRVYLLTQGVHPVDSSQVLNPSAASLVGIIRAMKNENIHININHLDLSPDETAASQLNEVFYNMWMDKVEAVAFRDGKRFCPRIASLKLPNEYLTLPNGCDRFQLVLPQTRLISDLEFSYLAPQPMVDDLVEVEVKAMALNFRDVFTVLKPIPLFESFNAVGLDFAGVITKAGPNVKDKKVGDRVIGMNMDKNLALPSHMTLSETLVIPLPTHMTFAEGVTLPAVFSTAVYCLINTAQMKKGETVLIHTASGGVGLCAIQLAKHIGANIIATAGSKRKRTFLKNLGIEHVLHSRTTDFGQQILEITNGRGVDIVLNSITGPGFKEASLGALAKNGRFVEMSKLNVWTVEEVKIERPDVFYSVVDLTTLEKPEYQKLIGELKIFLDQDFVRPIPYERFDALNIRGALNYLQKAKHIGKIICIMPEVKVEKAKFTTTCPMFNDESTYLITGGLGGIGFEVVKWMLGNGAKHIVIASRSSPKPEIQSQIDSWNKSGKHVQALAVDVGNMEQCRQLFDHIQCPTNGFPTIRGVMHAAGVLHDATIENMDWSKFLKTYNPKVAGTWNLHELTKNMLLEHFVLFSSIAAVFGSPGQTNHSASNSFEDALAYHRHSIGLPATCVNWGNWGEVGVATEIDFPGVRPIATSQGLLALETFLKTQRTHAAVINVDSFSLLSKVFPKLKTYIDDKRLFGEVKSNLMINSDEFWADVDAATEREDKVNVFKNFIKNTVKILLKLDQDEVIDDNAEFQSLGVDSLMMLEMKNGLQNVLGARMVLTAGQLKDCNTTEILSNKLVDILEGKEDDDQVLPTMDELKDIVREDACLPEHITIGSMTPKNTTDIHNVLLTGVTGMFGPYLLLDLCRRPQIHKVYCLIRKSGKMSPAERLHGHLEKCELLDRIDLSKVECLQGDLTDNLFGLEQSEYDNLSESIDAIVHSAVRADHNAKYWRAPDNRKSHVRTVNVLGTSRVLEFATVKTLKHVFHASTLLTITNVDEDGCFSEQWQDVGAFDNVTYNPGYPLSKHISEQLVKQAVQRGIPCMAFRLPGIAGDSSSGRCNYLMNHFVLRWLAFMKLGCMPDLPAPLPLIPVDTCAQLSLDIFFSPKAPFDVYNISQRHPIVEQQLIHIAQQKFGISIEPVSFKEFVDKLKLESDTSPLAPFRKTYEDDEFIKNMECPSVNCINKYLENTDQFFRCHKVSKVLPEFDRRLESGEVVMTRDLLHMKNTGVFEKFGIKCLDVL